MKLPRWLKWASAVLVLTAPLVVWAAFKPIRILAPALNGVSCTDRVCISNPPDDDLPAYARPYVAEYKAWEERVGRKNVWRLAESL